MASSTGHPVSRETYWKRRAFVLAGAMLLLALIAFACRPGADEGEPTRSEAGVDNEASPSVAPEDPSASPSGEPEEDPSEADASPSGDPEPSDDPSDAEGAGGGGGGSGGGEAAAPKRPEDACRPQDVVVTFDFAEKDKEIYGSGAKPAFEVTVVNTGEQTCTVDVGGESMEVRIHSGDDRIYSSADCADGESREDRQLSRGVPHEFTVTWDRVRSFADCRDGKPEAKPGWYRANLHGDYVGSVSQLVFQLKG
ncbi:hypothetical protein PWG71_13635 [Nocardiopsis sp. N85]|uniref:hypothetical protein n=1 Tax=Nocardiopsis sp. N85 TaxID=3029400 RepID=UPI00237F16F8|nr:hypothetical protein [Nocardiopsis sp. N85]MDE3722432.1 hypothetical protein [Nocardiopsis sp. N85]